MPCESNSSRVGVWLFASFDGCCVAVRHTTTTTSRLPTTQRSEKRPAREKSCKIQNRFGAFNCLVDCPFNGKMVDPGHRFC